MNEYLVKYVIDDEPYEAIVPGANRIGAYETFKEMVEDVFELVELVRLD